MAQQKRKVSKTSSNKIDHAAIAKKIDAIPSICPEGKKAVANLLIEFGYRPEPIRKPKVGEVWLLQSFDKRLSAYYIIAHQRDDQYSFVAINNDADYLHARCSLDEMLEEGTFNYTYPSIKEYAIIHCF